MVSVTDEPAIVTNSNVWKSCLFYNKMELIQERFVDIWVTNITNITRSAIPGKYLTKSFSLDIVGGFTANVCLVLSIKCLLQGTFRARILN